MNSIKGFSSLPSLADNSPGQIALFGELSTVSETFSRYKSNYANPALYPGVEFIGFTTKNDIGSQITLNGTVSGHILQVMHWVYGQYNASAIPSNANKATFINSLVAEFPDMTLVSINEILNGSLSQRMPDYIQWTFSDGGTDNSIKVWFSNSRFESQYDDYEIIVIPPVSVINQLNSNTAVVAALVAARTISEFTTQLAIANGGIPQTLIANLPLVWNDPVTVGATMTTNWSAVIYGAAGNDNDKIKAAVREYIANNSVLTVWPTIYPALYAENEFIVIPMWVDIASPESGLDVAMYRAATKAGLVFSRATTHVPSSYGSAIALPLFLNSNLEVASAFWRSINFLVVGNPNNMGGVYSFNQKFPDYMNLQPSSTDWGRLSVLTRNFIVKLNDALEKALTLTQISAVPVGYSRVVKSSKVYLSFTYGGFNYLVLSAGSFSV